jgi:hypothetical protein
MLIALKLNLIMIGLLVAELSFWAQEIGMCLPNFFIFATKNTKARGKQSEVIIIVQYNK